MLTTQKLQAMQPWEIIAQWEWIDDWKIFNIWRKWWNVQWVAVRWQGFHDRAIYYHLYSEEKAEKCDDIDTAYYYAKRPIGIVASNGDKLTGEDTIKTLVPCDDEAFNLYRD